MVEQDLFRHERRREHAVAAHGADRRNARREGALRLGVTLGAVLGRRERFEEDVAAALADVAGERREQRWIRYDVSVEKRLCSIARSNMIAADSASAYSRAS